MIAGLTPFEQITPSNIYISPAPQQAPYVMSLPPLIITMLT
jgi:hypothetical protein